MFGTVNNKLVCHIRYFDQSILNIEHVYLLLGKIFLKKNYILILGFSKFFCKNHLLFKNNLFKLFQNAYEIQFIENKPFVSEHNVDNIKIRVTNYHVNYSLFQ